MMNNRYLVTNRGIGFDGIICTAHLLQRTVTVPPLQVSTAAESSGAEVSSSAAYLNQEFV